LTPPPPSVLCGTTFTVQSQLVNGPIDLQSASNPTLDAPVNIGKPIVHVDSRPSGPVAPGTTSSSVFSVTLPNVTSYGTRPYFERLDINQPYYQVILESLRNAPQTPPPFTVRATVTYAGLPIEVRATVGTETPLPSGELFTQPLTIVPAVSIALDPRLAIIPKNSLGAAFTATLLNPLQKNVTVVPLGLPGTLDQVSSAQELHTKQSNIRFKFVTILPPNAFKDLPKSSTRIPPTGVQARSTDGGYDESLRPVGYPGIPTTNTYKQSFTPIAVIDVTTAPNLNIAYLPGTGDDVPSALDQLGVHPHILSTAALTPESLKPYDAVILGVRAYEHPELAAANSALNAYAAAGGIVIAQYNTGRLPQGTGPYPLDLGGSEKVVEEDAPVKILAPDNPLLNWPNKLTTADFDGWVEERGHGFMATWDPHYTPLLETHDRGQQPQLGGLLVARTGRGAWIYLGLALYRQLPEGVPGAYRLLANLISAGRSHAF
jgi:hypothetical protein